MEPWNVCMYVNRLLLLYEIAGMNSVVLRKYDRWQCLSIRMQNLEMN
jgi:hypothetical protein